MHLFMNMWVHFVYERMDLLWIPLYNVLQNIIYAFTVVACLPSLTVNHNKLITRLLIVVVCISRMKADYTSPTCQSGWLSLE